MSGKPEAWKTFNELLGEEFQRTTIMLWSMGVRKMSTGISDEQVRDALRRRDQRKVEQLQRWHMAGEQFRRDQQAAAEALKRALPAGAEQKALLPVNH